MNRNAACIIFLFVGGSVCQSAPFDMIVPSEVEIRTQPGIGGVGTPWGWIVSKSMPLTFDQLNNSDFDLTTDHPSVVVTTTFNPNTTWTPMQPGDVAGLDVPPFTDPLRALLQPTESVNPLSENFWRWQIGFPAEFVGTVTLHTVAAIDGWFAIYDTVLNIDASFGSDIDPLVVVSAHRISAIPEPSGSCLILASVFLASVMRVRCLTRRCSSPAGPADGLSPVLRRDYTAHHPLA